MVRKRVSPSSGGDVQAARAQAFGERLKNARLEAGLSQKELGLMAGLISVKNPDRSVIDWEAGKLIPYSRLRSIEEALNLPRGWLLHGEASWDEKLVEILDALSDLRNEMKTLRAEVRKSLH